MEIKVAFYSFLIVLISTNLNNTSNNVIDIDQLRYFNSVRAK
jgi:hypothetical protein